MDETDRKLLQLINDVLRNKGQPELPAIEGDPHLREDLKLDSLDLAELTVRVEERFGIDVFEAGVVSRYREIENRVIQHVRSGKQR